MDQPHYDPGSPTASLKEEARIVESSPCLSLTRTITQTSDFDLLPDANRKRWFDWAASEDFAQVKQWLQRGIISGMPPHTGMAQMSRACFRPLLPSFLGNDSKSISQKTSTTAYLHGVRGVAAFIVYTYHVYIGLSFRDLFDNPQPIPVLGALIEGQGQVCVFFVVSGFSISYKATRQIQRGDQASMDTISSSAFRRWPRLFLPLGAIMVIQGLMGHMGLVNHSMGYFPPFPQFDTIGHQMSHVFGLFAFLGNPLRGALGRYVHELMWPDYYDLSPWTISVEFLGSMVTFMTMIIGSRFTTRVRLSWYGLMAIMFFWCILWDMFLFHVGLLLAEIHCSRENRELNLDQIPLNSGDVEQKPARIQKSTSPWWNAYYIVQFIIALYLLSIRKDVGQGEPRKGFETVWRLVPQSWLDDSFGERFWASIGAAYYMFVIDSAEILQLLFTNRVAQYLGKISYCLYLIHSTCFRTIGWYLWGYLLVDTHILIRSCLSYIFLTFCTIWIADLATRHIDERAVRFTQRCDSKLRRDS